MKQIKILLTVLLLLPFLLLFSQQNNKLVILHTNDTHSQLEPTAPDAVRSPDMGGYARRLGVINQIREQEPNVLLVDAGDFSQGTPYYNFFKGRVEVQGINRMAYDAVTLGNHEFDNGMDTLAAILKLAEFPLVSSNYDVSKSVIAEYVKPYLVVEKGGIRIGIIGLGAELKGLVMEEQYKGAKYLDPVETVKKYERLLKKQKKCNVIVCLSHLGSDSTSTKINDFQVAKQSKYVDVFIGGHSHTLLENVKTNNAKGKSVLITQMGKSGLFLGRINLYLTKD
ncbi:MAG: metallophosphoesterase [Paludibacter sp.]|nr:metallophosphoesterase [Paludibacter sp.]